MNIQEYIDREDKKPLDHIVTNGGYCGIFRKIACVGDSLASGEFESIQNGQIGFHDFFEYSWGQYIARDAGCEVYNFSRGGMTAKEYCESFADLNGYWDTKYMAQAYIMALGVNDISKIINGAMELGSIEDIDTFNCYENKPTFAGFYGQIIQRYKILQPKAKFFLMTIPRDGGDEKRKALSDAHAQLLHQIAEVLDNCYILDLRQYAPEYDEKFKKKFLLGGHMNPAGYRLTALMVETYIDYIIRNNMDDFKQIGFVGTPYYNEKEKW